MRLKREGQVQVLSVVRFFHTVRYLRAEQVYGRLWHRLSVGSPSLRSAPPLRKPATISKFPPLRSASLTGPASFHFLNVSGDLHAPKDWVDFSRNKLWTYNLHYFDDLNAAGSDARYGWHRSLIQRWITENPPTKGAGWDPYPLSLRIVNWIKWALSGNRLEPEWIQSMAVQARWLRRRLEWHLRGNHYLANAKALVFVGLFFDGEEAEEWMKKGLQILDRELPEQILGDGGHFERSPMYHSIVLEDLLDLINLARQYDGVTDEHLGHSNNVWIANANSMRVWLKVMTHPDGRIALFNDSAFDVAPSPLVLEKYASRLNLEQVSDPDSDLVHLKDSGYLRLRQGPAVVFIDAAPLGPDYLPAHGHADTLTFELSLWGRRVLVDSGTSTYDEGAERNRQRGTSAHNTVCVDGENSSEVWGAFRVARRAHPLNVTADRVKDALHVSACHNGYRRLSGKPKHCREWVLKQGSLEIIDLITGDGTHLIEIFYHFHPDVMVKQVAGKKFSLSLGSNESATVGVETAAETRLESSSYHPEFGITVPSQRLVISGKHRLSVRVLTAFTWREEPFTH